MTTDLKQADAPLATPIDRTLKFLRRAAHRANDDRGPLRTINEIRQAVGADKETVRGYLIKLVARGDILLHDWSGGQRWEAVVPKKVAPVEVADGHFILQRELLNSGRSSWFDAETFTNSKRAKQALEFAKSNELARSQEFCGRRAQRIRLLSVPQGA